MNNLRKFRVHLARIVLPFLTIWLCVLPLKSYAVVPLVAVFATSSGSFITANIATATQALLAAGALGSALTYLELADTRSGGNPDKALRIPLTVSIPIPPPFAPPAVPIPATVDEPIICAEGLCSQANLDLNAIQAQWCSLPNGVSCGSTSSMASCLNNYAVAGIPSRSCKGTISSQPPCQPGYTMNVPAGQCDLYDARIATPDTKKDLARVGQTLVPADENVNDQSQQNLLTMPDGSYFINVGNTSAGDPPSRVQIIPQLSGGSRVVISSQVNDGTSTVVNNSTMDIASDGQLTSITGGTVSGSVPIDATPIVNNGTVNTGTSNVVFPGDYARSGESLQASATTNAKLDTTNAKLDTLHGDLSDTTTLGDPLEPAAGDMPSWGNTFSNLLSWQLPAHNSACPQPSFDFSGHTYAFTTHCDLVNNNTAPIQAAMMAVFTIMALFVVLRA